jgi:signal transduction histidine kinase
MSDELIAALGPLPRTHGMLGAMLESEEPFRASDLRRDPRFKGWWPSRHPQMRTFLGVPIVARSGIIGAFYLTESDSGEDFSERDQQLIEMLAAHAAIAIQNAQLNERSRELSIVEERNRLARELHDAVTQKLFGIVLATETVATLLDAEPGEARAQLGRLQELAHEAMSELRSLIFELRPAVLETEGLATTLRKHVDVLRRVDGREIRLHIGDVPRLDPATDAELFRIAQEALQNAIRHSQSEHIDVHLAAGDGRVRLKVADDGVGFDPAAPKLRSRRLGLTSMEERAEAVGGRLEIRSEPGAGTTVELDLALLHS